MKTKSLLLAGVAMAAALASCSNDDVISMPDIPKNNLKIGYAKVAISMPTNGTRADEVFDAGTAAEAKVHEIHLAVYDEYGTFVGSGELISDNTDGMGSPMGDPAGERGSDNVSDKYKKVFQLSLIEDANEPKQVVAFINTPLSNANLDELTKANSERVVTSYFKGQGADASEFAMTNAGYYDGSSNYVVAAQLETPVYATAGEAIKAETANTTIYVERLAAKVTVKAADEIEEALNYTIADVSGAAVSLKFTPTLWGATGVAQSEYLVKTKFTSHTDWNAANNFRSYWAEGVNYGKEFADYYNAETGKTTELLSYVTFKDVDAYLKSAASTPGVTEMGKSLYVPEHTSKLQLEDKDGAKYLVANTYSLILGQYAVQSEEHGEWFKKNNEIDFYLLLAGVDDNGKKKYTIYNETQLMGVLLSYNGFNYVSTSAEGTDAKATRTKNNTDLLSLTQYFDLQYNAEVGKYMLVAKGTQKLYGAATEDGEFTEITVSEDMKSTNSRHYYYNNGMAYFNAAIAHDKGETATTYGVVRNHSYVLTINKIENLGAPLDFNGHEGEDGTIEPDPIIPNPDELKDHFIQATINVLSWHVKSNDVTL